MQRTLVGLGAGLMGGGVWMAVIVGAAACGGGGSGVDNAKLPEGVRSEDVAHEACDEGGHKVDILDANGDGKPDIKRVYDKTTGKEVCRITDLNHDGKPDMFEYFDPSGQLRRREADYDDTGVVDAIELFDHGKLTQRELDTTGQHRIDTWDFFDAQGKRVRRERDSTNDGRVDQWWTFDGDKVTIAFDRNGDGKPDPNDTVTLGAGDQAAGGGGGGGADAAPPPSTASTLGQGLDAGAMNSAQPSTADASILAMPTSTPVSAGPGIPDAGGGSKKPATTSTTKKGGGKK